MSCASLRPGRANNVLGVGLLLCLWDEGSIADGLIGKPDGAPANFPAGSAGPSLRLARNLEARSARGGESILQKQRCRPSSCKARFEDIVEERPPLSHLIRGEGIGKEVRAKIRSKQAKL